MLEKKINLKSAKVGSALIMTIVLTVLLSIVAVMFVMVARMDSASTSNIVDSKTLDNAVKSLIAIISKELIFDTPGVVKIGPTTDPNYLDYQDYPDANDAWLASIEPYHYIDPNIAPADSNVYKWRQISDVTGYLKSSSATKKSFATQHVNVDPVPGHGPGNRDVIDEYPDIKLDGSELEAGKQNDGIKNDEYRGQLADADGDGIADSKWIELTDLHSSKGKKVYAAVRIIDNCAMINVNTAYKFDPNTTDANDNKFMIDGTSPLQVNLEGMLKSGDNIDILHKARCGGDADAAADTNTCWSDYDKYVEWDPCNPLNGKYTPFDISDELELRYRYCIDSNFAGRIETDANATTRWYDAPDSGKLYNTDSGWGLSDWQTRIAGNRALADADRRHLLTTYSFDRIIDPNGRKMFYVLDHSDGDATDLFNRLKGGISVTDNNTAMVWYLSQIAANIVDYGDSDLDVSNVGTIGSTGTYYGYEPPFIFISEIARNFQDISGQIYRSYAVELYKNFDKNKDQNFSSDDWYLDFDVNTVHTSISLSSDMFDAQGGQYCVIVFENSNAPLPVHYTDSPKNGAVNVSSEAILRWPAIQFLDTDGNSYPATEYKLYLSKVNTEVGISDLIYTGSNRNFTPGSMISAAGTYQWDVVGSYGGLDKTRGKWEFTVGNPQRLLGGTFPGLGAIKLFRRVGISGYIPADDVNMVKDSPIDYNEFTQDVIDGPMGKESNLGVKSYRRDMRWNYYLKRRWAIGSNPTLGHDNNYMSSVSDAFAIPFWYNRFTTVGDAAMVFYKSTYPIILQSHINDFEVNGKPDVRFDPYYPSMQNVFKYITTLRSPYGVNEMRVRGRININTAPAFVISQLPWVSGVRGKSLKIADAIVAYRDKTQVGQSPDYSNRQSATGLTGSLESKYKVRTEPGFSSIGELMNVINGGINGDFSRKEYDIRYCGIDTLGGLPKPQYGFPGLYDNDALHNPDGNDTNVANDLEEKEMIFARISDLATVRSDTFTAYILVRLGVDGPQKRFIAILDRSGVTNAGDKVRVVAFQQVPAAR